MILQETFTLSNGVTIPKLGLGTWFIEDADAPEAVRQAAKLGYRHFDTAEGYGNERGVSEGVRTCGVARGELFVTTKLQAVYKTYAEAKTAIDESLRVSGLDYFDLLLIHAPQPWTEFREGNHYYEGNLEAWRAMEEAYKAGKLRAVGVANFEKEDLDNLLEHGTIKPMVNQILAHPSNTPVELIAYTQSRNMLVEAYSPVAHGEALKNPALAAMAKKYGVSIPALCIRYCLQLGLLPLPKTANPAHMADNANVNFIISEADMDALLHLETIRNYGDASLFPVYGGKMEADFTCRPRDFKARK